MGENDAVRRSANRVDAGTTPRNRFRRVDVSAIAENVAEAFGAVAEEDGKRIVARIQPDIEALGDQEVLTQMLVNLVENSLSHTPSGTAILIQLEQAAGGPYLTASDYGRGIPSGERERVFHRFYRLDARRSTPGSGLGLSFVAAVAKLHDATVSLEDNEPGLRVVVAFP